MAINLVEIIQQQLGCPPLHKIDPNTQEINQKNEQSTAALLAQASIPAVLTAIYSLSANEEVGRKLLEGNGEADSLHLLFNSREPEVIEKVARYAEVLHDQSESFLKQAADAALQKLVTLLGDAATPASLKAYMKEQRHTILVYLPPALNLGELLRDNTLDDRTNKMEGPVSGFMHKIEDKLSQGGA